MGLRVKFIVMMIIIFFSLIPHAKAAWDGPVEIINMIWGSQPGQVAIKYGDTEDDFPHIFRIDQNGNTLIGDSGNTRLQIFSSTGALTKIITPIGFPTGIIGWPLQWEILSGAKVLIKRGDKYQIYDYQGNLVNQFTGVATYIGELVTLSDDTIVVYKTDTKSYSLYSPTGALIRTTTDRPLELGKVKEKKTAAGYVYTIQYPDITPNTVKTYTVTVARPAKIVTRDKNGNLYITTTGGEHREDETNISKIYNWFPSDIVYRFDTENRLTGSMQIPDSEHIEEDLYTRPTPKITIIAQYGEPVISPSGDVYTWKRTPTTYSIIKWTWR